MQNKDKRKGSKKANHFKASNDEDEQNLLQYVQSLLDSLYEMRLVQKISRPLNKQNKQQMITTYGQKLQALHDRLIKIRTQIVQNNTLSQTGAYKGNKSVLGQATTKPDDWKKVIRNIQNKYSQILIDGSFKHYRKVVYLLGLTESHSMALINIQEWAAACLDNRANGSCC